VVLPMTGGIVMLDTESFLLGIATGGGGDGGNPNYVETLNGTLGNPIPYSRYSEILNDLENGNATMYIKGSLTGVGPYTLYAQPGATSHIMAFFADVVSTYLFSGCFYFPNREGEILDLYVIQYTITKNEAVNISSLFNSDDPVTTTIIHHPMP